MPRSRTAWKEAERKVARFLGGRRRPSQGISHEDIEGEWFTAEHKYREPSDYSAEFRKLLSQMDENKSRYPEKLALGVITFHSGTGVRNRTYVLTEVDLSKDGTILKNLMEVMR